MTGRSDKVGPPSREVAMPAAIVARTETAFTIQIEIPYGSSMLESEETIQEHLNRAGILATGEALQRFDTDGTPLVVADTKLTSMGRVLKEYQTPYGVAPVERHLYQSSRGGKTYCPLDRNARIIGSSTPRFAKIISHKYAEFGSSRVIEDLRENHGRTVARSFVQNVADAVAAVALAQEEDWEYARPSSRADRDDHHRDGRHLPADVRGRVAGDDGRHHRVL